MNKISFCCTTNNPNFNLFKKMLHSAWGFDEYLVHINKCEDKSKLIGPFTEIIANKNLTAAEGFNFVISHAKYEWICPFCDDDFFHYENLKTLINFVHASSINADIIRFQSYSGNENKGWTPLFQEEPSYEKLKEKNMLPFSSFYRKSLWKAIGGYDNLRFNDWGFWLKAYKIGAKAIYWPTPIYYFRSGIETRLSDKERKEQPFELSRIQLICKAEEMDEKRARII